MKDLPLFPFVARPKNYPRPRLRVSPETYRPKLRWGGDRKAHDWGASKAYSYGRYALYEALKIVGANPSGAVLIPAFHCRTMVDPVLNLGIEPRFYRINENLAPDFESMERANADRKVQAMLLTHYFGYASDVKKVSEWCQHRGIELIEDCAHAIYTKIGDVAVGSSATASIASFYKFLPSPDGAFLLVNSKPSLSAANHQPLKQEIKSIGRVIESAIFRSSKTVPTLTADSSSLIEQADNLVRLSSQATEYQPESSPFKCSQIDSCALLASLLVWKFTDHNIVQKRRRYIATRWLKALSDLPIGRPLFQQLPQGAVPYVFPIIGDIEGRLFHFLRLAGIGVLRWENFYVSDCDVAKQYRMSLLQLPCHQDIHDDELDEAIALVVTFARSYSS